MKLLVFSDSHKHNADMERIIGEQGKDAEHILHLGDCLSDAEFMSRKFPEFNFIWVRGNCDYSSEPSEKMLTLNGKRVFITHGHNYHVKLDYQRIVYAALEREADVCLFGHSHEAVIFYEHGVLFMNPGSISLPRGTDFPSYGKVHITDGGAEGFLYNIKPI